MLRIRHTVFPNPITGDRLYIENSPFDGDDIELLLFDLTGRLLMRQQLGKANATELDVTSLPKGIYLLNLIKGKEKYNYKIVK